MLYLCLISLIFIKEKPEEVKGCTISFNSTMSGGVLMVKCIPGWDGGLPQTFTLEVRKAAHVHARVLAALQHSSQPIFVLRNLQPSVEYLLTVTSANPRGTSPPVTLTYTSPNSDDVGQTDKHSKPQSSLMKLIPYLAIFVALIVILTTCGSIIACIAKSRAAGKAEMLKIQRKMSYSDRKLSSDLSMPPGKPLIFCKDSFIPLLKRACTLVQLTVLIPTLSNSLLQQLFMYTTG